jgi:hypothetical protein
MKNVIVVLIFILSLQLFAQGKSAQVCVGLNQSWLNYDESFINDCKPDFRPKLNLSLNYNFAEFGYFTTSVGIRYYNLGRALTLDFGNSREEAAKIDHYLISLPLQIQYKVAPINTAIIFNAETSYLLTSNSKGPEPNSNLLIERDITNEMHRIQFSIGIGAEYTFIIAKETFGIKSIFNFGLTKIPKEDIFKFTDGSEYYWVSYRSTELNISFSYSF